MKTKTRHKSTTKMTMTDKVVDGIKSYIGDFPAERGGLLGSDTLGLITHFVPDTTARCSRGAYDPDIAAMNRQIKEWKSDGIDFVGFVHSHPPGVRRLSSYDIWYAGEIAHAFKKLDVIRLPLVMTVPDTGTFEIIPYSARPFNGDRRQVQIDREELSVIAVGDLTLRDGHDDKAGADQRYFGNFPSLLEGDAPDVLTREMADDRAGRAMRDQYLDRLMGHFDIDHLDRTRVIVIGVGGAVSLVRNMARMGFGEFVLFDPDKVSESNIGSQQAQPNAVGEHKVTALASDIRELNPAAAVVTVSDRIEAVTDVGFESLVHDPMRMKPKASNRNGGKPGPLKPKQVLLLVLTDNFWAQARGHRLGLQFGLPTVCAQEYKDGLGAEVTYTVPGLTPACHRCMTASRYKAYLEDDFANDVTSHGAPIFGAEYLNGVLGHIVLALAFHGTNHPHWGEVIERLGNRNLLRMRMHPNFDQHFGNTFARRHEGAACPDSLFMLDTLFLAQTPDCGQSAARPTCPDCGGTGKLTEAIGAFADTRDMPS